MSIEFLKTDYEKVDYLRNLLVSKATGQDVANFEYQQLREELLSNKKIEKYFPIWIRTHSNLSSFWRFIKEEYSTYQERTAFINKEFSLVLSSLNSGTNKAVSQSNETILSKDSLVQSIKEYFTHNKEIKNIFGNFKLTKKILGNGGTSEVKEFEFNSKKYAIKFLISNIIKKENTEFKRFKQAHLNLLSIQHTGVILPQVHFDSIKISDEIELPYIIMPKAEMTLKKFVEEKKKKNEFNFTLFEKLFNGLINILEIIHSYHIIHRDIKPENIFILNKKLVLGDFDIAKFDDKEHVKLVDTKKGDRLANFYYSAPEQSDKSFDEITFAADWYAFGQILYWLITGNTLRGQEDISFSKYDTKYGKYESLIKNLLSNDPSVRLSSKDDIFKYLENKKKVTWEETLYNFDNIVFKYMSEFGMSGQGVKKFNDTKSINEIMSDLATDVLKLNLWWSQGYSDINIYDISKEKYCDRCWLVGLDEIKIKSIWFYKHYSSFGCSCIIVETDNFEPTGLYPDINEYEEFGILDDNYITRQEYDTGWAVINDTRVKLNGKAKLRGRILSNTIYFLAPQMGPLITNDKIIDQIYQEYKQTKVLDSKLLEPLTRIQKNESIVSLEY